MRDIETLENRRLSIQAQIDSQKSQLERNQLGQFATPTALAREILRYAKNLFENTTKVRFLDPAIGTGSFYSALCYSFPDKQLESASGFEIDKAYYDAAQNIWGNDDVHIQLRDFTKLCAPKEDYKKPNLIICNPPYVRHQHINLEDKFRMQAHILSFSGLSLSGLSGLYCYFLLLSYEWMSDEGIAGWLIPSEFMDVNYGRIIKSFLLQKVTLLHIHRFEPNDVQFADALVSSAIVWFQKKEPSPNHNVLFTYGGPLLKPHILKSVPAEVLEKESKWTRFPKLEIRNKNPQHILFKDLFSIKRGIATGDNKFFILSLEEIKANNLPLNFFHPILPSPRFLPFEIINADSNGIPLIPTPLFLLDCKLPEEEIKKKYQYLWNYLKKGIELGIADHYLCSHREPWYSQEERPPSPFLCTYIGRSDNPDKKTFRFILNYSNATATNSFLLIYPKDELKQAMESNPSLKKHVWQKLNEIGPAILLQEGRVYGGGLHKLEPKELALVSAQSILEVLPKSITEPLQTDLFAEVA